MEEKKESWIETLIELLNEFDIFREYVEVDLEDCNDPIVLRVISKNYGFIKWLVDNDKIDFDTIPNKIKEIWMPILIQWEIQYWFDSSDLYWLLMVLSIQDNPIEFLVSILK